MPSNVENSCPSDEALVDDDDDKDELVGVVNVRLLVPVACCSF